MQPLAKNIYKFKIYGKEYAAKELSYSFPINGSELISQFQSKMNSQQHNINQQYNNSNQNFHKNSNANNYQQEKPSSYYSNKQSLINTGIYDDNGSFKQSNNQSEASNKKYQMDDENNSSNNNIQNLNNNINQHECDMGSKRISDVNNQNNDQYFNRQQYQGQQYKMQSSCVSYTEESQNSQIQQDFQNEQQQSVFDQQNQYMQQIYQQNNYNEDEQEDLDIMEYCQQQQYDQNGLQFQQNNLQFNNLNQQQQQLQNQNDDNDNDDDDEINQFEEDLEDRFQIKDEDPDYNFIKNNYLQNITKDITCKLCQKMKSILNEIDILYELNSLENLEHRNYFVKNYYINFDFQNKNSPDHQDQFEEDDNSEELSGTQNEDSIVKTFELKVFLIQELLQFNLQNYINNQYHNDSQDMNQIFNYKIQCYSILEQLVTAIDIMIQNKIVHIDLKPPNIMLDANLNVKIIDFGSARKLNDSEKMHFKGVCITYGYSAPELLLPEPNINEYNDIWSFGIIMLSMLTGLNFYCGKTELYKNQIFTLYKDGNIQSQHIFDSLKEKFIQANQQYQYNFGNLMEQEEEIIKLSCNWIPDQRIQAPFLIQSIQQMKINLEQQFQEFQQQ